MATKYNDYPLSEIAEAVERLAGKGWECYQKFTCEKCGERLTMEPANTLYTSGKCDKCGHLTDIKKNGCNYLAVGRNKGVHDLSRDQRGD